MVVGAPWPQVHLRDKPVAEGIDYVSLAALMGGMSGAQIAGVANNACYLASREGRVEVQQVGRGGAGGQSSSNGSWRLWAGGWEQRRGQGGGPRAAGCGGVACW